VRERCAYIESSAKTSRAEFRFCEILSALVLEARQARLACCLFAKKLEEGKIIF
jgi:hypothetical protein